MKSLKRLVLPVAMISMIGDGPLVALQNGNLPVVDRVVAIGVLLNVRPGLYAPASPDVPVIYADEDIQLDLSVGNGSEGTITLGDDTGSWLDDIRIEVERAQLANPQGGQVRITARTTGSFRGRVTLPPGGSTGALLVLRTDSAESVPPGTYTISVEVPAVGVVAPDRNIARRRVSFEVREALARNDTLDRLLHDAYRARLAQRPQDERSALNRLLEIHPNSLAAWIDLSTSYSRQGDCQNATPALERALSLLRSNGDPELRVRPPASTAESLQQDLQTCGTR